MNITASSLTNGTLTAIIDNGAQILTARTDHPKWAEILEAYKAQNNTRLLNLMSMVAVIEEYSTGQLVINGTGVVYKGRPCEGVDVDRIMSFMRDGLPYQPIANYMERMRKNPSARAIEKFYPFSEHRNMPITPEGFIIAYKGVQDDYYSVTGNLKTVVLQGIVNEKGQILNSIGATIEVERSSVDDNYDMGCSFGLHAGSLEYAVGFSRRVLLVMFDPADIIMVPSDCNCQKVRLCKYKVIGEYTGPMPSTYTDEFNDKTTTDDSDSDDSEDADNCKPTSFYNKCDESAYDEDWNICDKCLNPTDTCDCNFTPTVPDPVLATEPTLSKQDIDNCVSDCLTQSKKDKANKDTTSISTRLRNVIVEVLGITHCDIKDDSTYISLGMDSLDAVELIMGIEMEFDLDIDDKYMSEPIGNGTVLDWEEFLRTELQSHKFKGDPFLNGIDEGSADNRKGYPSLYTTQDKTSADSYEHERYIEGYVVGYTRQTLIKR